MTGYRIVVRWDGVLRKGYIKIAEMTYYLSRPLTWFKAFDLWYIPEVHHLEARDDATGPKRELDSEELALIATKVREIGGHTRPIEDLL